MIIGGNQPYFMPYIGYWQLINAVDVFIISDDYNYIERGWINRNRILQNGQAKYFNIEIDHATSMKRINELYLSKQFDPDKKLMQLKCTYGKALHFPEGYALMEKILRYDGHNLAGFLEHSIQCVCDYLEITTKFILSSSIPGNCLLKKEYRIYDQCKYVGADCCINAIGGQKLYTYKQFREQGIKLGFIQTDNIQYNQQWYDFVPNLSIIDVIMFNSRKEIQQMLNKYTILWEDSPQ